eukprot:7867004-Pyramimonas_sp.AAC.1
MGHWVAEPSTTRSQLSLSLTSSSKDHARPSGSWTRRSVLAAGGGNESTPGWAIIKRVQKSLASGSRLRAASMISGAKASLRASATA